LFVSEINAGLFGLFSYIVRVLAVKTIRKIIPIDKFVFIDCIFTAYKPIHVPNLLLIYLLIGLVRIICAIFQGFGKNN
jgi:hypothetical protein